jgi:hypothetical protein
MRYRRQQQKIELIQDLAELFGSLPNHTAHCTGGRVYLIEWDATSGKSQKWAISELQNMSKGKLKELISSKRELVLANGLVQWFTKRSKFPSNEQDHLATHGTGRS